MKIKFSKILTYIFLIFFAFASEVNASDTSSIAITVTIREIVSEVIVTPPPNQSGDPGETLTYTFIVKNNGNSQDTYHLEVSSSNDWKTELSGGDTIGPLSPGQEAGVGVSLTIPKNAPANKEDILTLTATSLSDSSASGSGSATTTVNQVASVSIRFSPRNRRVRAGETVFLRATIMNRGNGDDYFKLTTSSSLGWEVNFPQGDVVGPIEAGGREIVTITVTVPVDARSGDEDRVTITATSQFDPSVSDSSFSAIIAR